MGKILPGLRARRKAAGLSQEELAAAVGCTYQAVGAWERGDVLPTAERLPALAEALGCSIDDLYRKYEEKDPSTLLRSAQDDTVDYTQEEDDTP